MQRLIQFDVHHVLAATPGVISVLFAPPTCWACRLWQRLLEAMPDLRVFEVDVQRAFEVFHLPGLLIALNGSSQRPLNCRPYSVSVHAGVAELLRLPAGEVP
jgi:hypothetical protein